MDRTSEDGLRQRGRGLEEGYFQKLERERIKRMRAENERREARRRLACEAGLDDESSDSLLEVGIRAEVLPALDWGFQ